MKRSTTRILTTHTGSLPRPQDLLSLMIEEQARPGMERTALDAAIQRAVAEVVQKQAATGLDVINDGEQGRVDYTVYIKDRLTGFDGESAPPLGTGNEEFPELAAILRQFASPSSSGR
jgi:5-methyltetrahydropteroyltriglutamate--homocysteine methyltransferase